METNQTNIKQDVEKAKSLFDKGMHYLSGDGCEKDLDAALSCFIRSVWYGYPRAARNVGILLSSNVIENPDFEEAFWYFLHAAKSGDNVAQVEIGKFFCKVGAYKNSEHPPYNPYSANVWFEKAADAGNVQAAFMYGVNLLDGLGCGQNIVRAKQYFEFGAEKGHVGCMYNLALICDGQAYGAFYFDEQKAGYWFNEAAQKGNKQAIQMLNKYKYSNWTKKWSKKI